MLAFSASALTGNQINPLFKLSKTKGKVFVCINNAFFAPDPSTHFLVGSIQPLLGQFSVLLMYYLYLLFMIYYLITTLPSQGRAVSSYPAAYFPN